LLADSGVENTNTDVDDALKTTEIERKLAQLDVSYSNSMVEALWRQVKHAWLFQNRLDTLATVERLVAFYIEHDNSVMPHGALKGRTPDEVRPRRSYRPAGPFA
jgi:putative transposase